MPLEGKYNVLIMRDDSAVRTYRLNPGKLKFLLWSLAALIVVAATALGVGVAYWKAGYGYKKDALRLTKELQEARVQVERLENMQKILEAGGKPISAATLAAITPAPSAPAQPAQANASDAAKPAQAVDLFDLFASADTRVAKLENLKAGITGNRLNIAFDITNIDSSKQIRGKVRLFLIGRDAAPREVAGKTEEMAFLIQRYKHFQTSLPLPKGMADADVFALRIVLNNSSGEVIYSETQQISHLSS